VVGDLPLSESVASAVKMARLGVIANVPVDLFTTHCATVTSCVKAPPSSQQALMRTRRPAIHAAGLSSTSKNLPQQLKAA
jgi:hypothetical protein